MEATIEYRITWTLECYNQTNEKKGVFKVQNINPIWLKVKAKLINKLIYCIDFRLIIDSYNFNSLADSISFDYNTHWQAQIGIIWCMFLICELSKRI